jgi:hypothetical protein
MDDTGESALTPEGQIVQQFLTVMRDRLQVVTLVEDEDRGRRR